LKNFPSVFVLQGPVRGCGGAASVLSLQGAVQPSAYAGAALSQTIAGSLVDQFNFNFGFLFLGAVALAAFAILYFLMPETRNRQFLEPNP
jgi:sugar phosphate permease